MILVAWALAQAAVDATPAAASPTTLQGQFENANDALRNKQWQAAADGFAAIAARPKLSGRTRGIVLMREGSALMELRWFDEARETLRKGLELAPATDAGLNDDRVATLIALGDLSMRNYDQVAARRDLEDALRLATDRIDRLNILRSLVGATMFEDNAAALVYVDQAMTLLAAQKVEPVVDARFRDLRARVLLNHGDTSGALAELQIALRDLGGLTSRTDIDDVVVRADLALTHLLAHHLGDASKYLEMTGEGRVPGGPFATPADTDVPPCGDILKPDDVAVIEFGIGNDGSIIYANPVYASRAGPVAVEFARAVRGWSWRAGEVAKIPPFYRAATRIELRCSTAAKRPEVLTLLVPAIAAWLRTQNLVFPDLEGDNRPSPETLRASIAQKEKPDADDVGLIPLLTLLASSPSIDRAESSTSYQRAADIAIAHRAPIGAQVYLRVQALEAAAYDKGFGNERYAAGLAALLADRAVEDDPQTAAVVRLLMADPPYTKVDINRQGQLLQAVADDRRLDAHDPLHTGALVRLAAVQLRQGNVDAARSSFASTGLSDQQCALVDAKPALKKAGVSSHDYPMDALMMGMTGWTRIELDVLADGSTTNRRAILSYPPFVFSETTVKGMANARYTQTYRPNGTLGCGGLTQMFRYGIPGI